MKSIIHYLYDRHPGWITAIESRIDWISLIIFLSYFLVRIPFLHDENMYSVLTWSYCAVFAVIVTGSMIIHYIEMPCRKTIIANLCYEAVILTWILTMYLSR